MTAHTIPGTVHPGLEAQVLITAFSMRNAKPLKGRVMSVSADRPIDERTGQAYYRARIELTENPETFVEMYQFWCQKV